MFLKETLMRYLNQTRYMQYYAALLATLPFASGVMIALWASPALPKLTSADSPIGYKIDAEESSWIASSLALGGGSISLFTMIFVDLVGRKTWLLIAGVVLSVLWIIIYFAKHVILLYIARFLGGVGSSAAFMVVPVYIGEIVDKDIRGTLSIAGGIAGLCGSVFIFTVGPFVSYFTLAIICFIYPTVFLVLFYFMPETPYYQVKIGQEKAALDTLTLLASKTVDSTHINERLKEIGDNVVRDMQNRGNIWECISKKDYRKSLIIMLGAKTLSQLSGLQVIEAYAQSIIEKTDSIISPEYSSLLFGCVQIPAALIAGFLIDRLGRKPLWIASAIGCAVSLFGEGLYFFLDETDSIEWLPTTCILIYFIMCPLGVATMPFVIAGEIFSTNIKSAAISLATLYGSGLAFASLKFAEPVAEDFGRYTVLWTYACVCVLGVFFILFVVPETKGKSLEEIQQILNKNRRTETVKEKK